MDFRNAKELLELCRQTDLSISEIMRQREIRSKERQQAKKWTVVWQKHMRSCSSPPEHR